MIAGSATAVDLAELAGISSPMNSAAESTLGHWGAWVVAVLASRTLGGVGGLRQMFPRQTNRTDIASGSASADMSASAYGERGRAMVCLGWCLLM